MCPLIILGYLYVYMKLLDIIFESVVDLSEYKKLTKDEFINSAQQIHKDENGNPKYTYDNVDYVNNKTDVLITCPIHGDFPQSPSNHLAGRGCKKCPKQNTQSFIKNSELKYGKGRYDYSKVKYRGVFNDVEIICHNKFKNGEEHGPFIKSPNEFLNKGRGCKYCGYEIASKKNSDDKDSFIKKAQSMKVHQNPDGSPRYTYDNVDYISSHEKVFITCPIHSPIHGDFPQSPANHLAGNGCPWCNESKGEKQIKNILTKNKINYIPFKKYDDCISVKSKNGQNKNCVKLSFDFYLPDNNTLIEFDGQYHFSGKQYENQDYVGHVLNDREKNEYTKSNGLKLIRIGYHDMKNIEEEIMKGLDSTEQLYLSTKYPIDKGWRDNNI